jgi:hypothetical protein
MTSLHTGGPVICAFEDKAIARHALRARAANSRPLPR